MEKSDCLALGGTVIDEFLYRKNEESSCYKKATNEDFEVIPLRNDKVDFGILSILSQSEQFMLRVEQLFNGSRL